MAKLEKFSVTESNQFFVEEIPTRVIEIHSKIKIPLKHGLQINDYMLTLD
jgi:hypothetical protein